MKIFLAFLLAASLPLYHFGIFVGYDSPTVYAQILVILYFLLLSGPAYSTKAKWLSASLLSMAFAYLLSNLLSLLMLSDVVVSKIITQQLRFSLTFLFFYALFKICDKDFVLHFERYEMLVALILGAIGIYQILNIYFDVGERFFILPTNPTYKVPGSAEVLYGEYAIVRVTSIFPEPIMWTFYMLSPVVKSLIRNRNIALIGFLVVPYLFSLSFNGITTLLAGLILLLLFRKNYGELIFLILLIFLMYRTLGDSVIGERLRMITEVTDPSLLTRLATFEEAIDSFLKTVVFGMGSGNYNAAGLSDLSINNLYLLLLAENGLIFFAFFMLFIGRPLVFMTVNTLDRKELSYHVLILSYLIFYLNFNDIYSGIFVTQLAIYFSLYHTKIIEQTGGAMAKAREAS